MNHCSTALVTGAKGSLGRYVVHSLKRRGWNVIGIGHKDPKDDLDGLDNSQWIGCNLSLDNLLLIDRKPDLIVHCAGGGAVGVSMTNPYLDFEKNVKTTIAVLEYIRSNCPEAVLVYPSSAAVYGNAIIMPISENSTLSPSSPYGVHKKMAEELVVEYAKYFGVKAAVVRLFSIYGEGFRKQLLWDTCKKIQANQSVFYGTGFETRDWLHVTDAAELLIEAADHASISCPIVNGGSGESVSVGDVVTELFLLMGRTDKPTFCGTEKPGDPKHFHADMILTSSWNWRPTIGWKKGLKRYVDWFKKDPNNLLESVTK